MEAYNDSVMQYEYALLSGMFQFLNSYFCEKDFLDINSDEITSIWSSMNELKYAILRRSPRYREIVVFEEERNDHIVDNIMNILDLHPGKRVLVAVGVIFQLPAPLIRIFHQHFTAATYTDASYSHIRPRRTVKVRLRSLHSQASESTAVYAASKQKLVKYAD